MHGVAQINEALATQQAAQLARRQFINDAGLERIFGWFASECARLRRPDDAWAPITVYEIDAGARIVSLWKELRRREVEDPYRERIKAGSGTVEDESEGRLRDAWAGYRVTLPSLLHELDQCRPRQDFIEWLGLSEADLKMIPPANHGSNPADPPKAFTLELARRIRNAEEKWRHMPARRRGEIPLMMAHRRKQLELEASEQRLVAIEGRIGELEQQLACLLGNSKPRRAFMVDVGERS